jgi:hypothetical protein
MSKKDPVLENMKKELGVKATSKCNRLSYLNNLVIGNQGKPVSKVTAISKLNITDRTFYRYVKQLRHLTVKNGMLTMAA